MGSSYSQSVENLFDCEGCLAPVMRIVDTESSQATDSRLLFLTEGGTFYQKSLGGLTQTKMTLSLSEDHSSLNWKVEATMLSGESFGYVDMCIAEKIVVDGQKSFHILDKEKNEIFGCLAENTEQRDKWVVALNELLDSWVTDPSKKPKATQSGAARVSDKAEYFAQREAAIEERKKAAQAKREKYASGGMKHTAAAMMRA